MYCEVINSINVFNSTVWILSQRQDHNLEFQEREHKCDELFVKEVRSRSLQGETKTGMQMLNSWRRKHIRSKCKTKVRWRKKRTRYWIKTANSWKMRRTTSTRKPTEGETINCLRQNTAKSHFVSQLGHFLALVVPNSSNWMDLTYLNYAIRHQPFRNVTLSSC